jgi:hypothetical protein
VTPVRTLSHEINLPAGPKTGGDGVEMGWMTRPALIALLTPIN